MSLTTYSGHIHLLYVPTLACNLGCRYCYLGTQTNTVDLHNDSGHAVTTLRRTLDAFLDAGVLPFNVSLHGGEPSMLPPAVLAELFTIIQRHYLDHYDALKARGFRKSEPHIKTNLFNFHKRYELFERHKVSISASIDLPLSLHGSYRTTRRGTSWLRQTQKNLSLLARYTHAKKISCTLYHEHLHDIPAILADIRMLHHEIGFDMNNFNIMFGFESGLNRETLYASRTDELQPASEQQQLELYRAMQDEFMGTELEEGFKKNWFDEFTPSYCTNAFNCGERFLLVQGDGQVWSCVRGQGLPHCYYGNILTDPVEEILAAGRSNIARLHQQAGLDEECRHCDYLHICHTGCPVVKLQKGNGRSYTCALQKAIYRDNPRSYPPAATPEQQQQLFREYAFGMHPALAVEEQLTEQTSRTNSINLPNDLGEEKNALTKLIAVDPLLRELYSDSAILLEINNEPHPLYSQILRDGRELFSIGPEDRLTLQIRRSLFSANCSEPIRNTLFLQMLRDTRVEYGDEQRSKQEHLFSHQIFFRLLPASNRYGDECVMADLSPLLALHASMFMPGVLNNLFVTTGFLRDYHYQKQKSNAFYHIQAINLPFQNFEFYWDT